MVSLQVFVEKELKEFFPVLFFIQTQQTCTEQPEHIHVSHAVFVEGTIMGPNGSMHVD